MTINGAVWFMVGGVIGAVLGCVTAYGIALARDYAEANDYYDPIEIETPSYEDMLEFDEYDAWLS